MLLAGLIFFMSALLMVRKTIWNQLITKLLMSLRISLIILVSWLIPRPDFFLPNLEIVPGEIHLVKTKAWCLTLLVAVGLPNPRDL